MANLKSSKKSILISQRNHDRNKHFKTKMKSQIKKAADAVEEKAENRESQVRAALKVIDKTVSKGIINKKTAARKKSALAIAYNKSASAKAKTTKPQTKIKAKPKANAPAKKTKKSES